MFSVQAHGYVLLRAGRPAEGYALLDKLADLDASTQTRTDELLAVLRRPSREEDRED
jgi:hypothetical protein